MLLFLSADEIGSLHERMKDLMRMGPWPSFLPFLIVLLGGCVWSFVQLWVTPSERRFVPGLILGFGILVSVGGQEFLSTPSSGPWYLSPFRSAFEERLGARRRCSSSSIRCCRTPRVSSRARDRLQGPAFSSVADAALVLRDLCGRDCVAIGDAQRGA